MERELAEVTTRRAWTSHLRARGKRLAPLAIGSILAPTLIALGLPRLIAHTRAVAPAATRTCAAKDDNFLGPRDLASYGQFEQDVDLHEPNGPPLPLVPQSNQSNSPAFRDYLDGRMRGYLNEVAITGPDRPAEDAFARSLGYSVGHIPLVPLVGKVVADNGGVLEVYEEVLAFRSTAGARQVLTVFRDSRGGQADMTVADVHFQLGDEPVGYALTPSSGDAHLEHWVRLETRFGTTVLSLTVQGGSQLAAADAEALLVAAAQRLHGVCPSAA